MLARSESVYADIRTKHERERATDGGSDSDDGGSDGNDEGDHGDHGDDGDDDGDDNSDDDGQEQHGGSRVDVILITTGTTESPQERVMTVAQHRSSLVAFFRRCGSSWSSPGAISLRLLGSPEGRRSVRFSPKTLAGMRATEEFYERRETSQPA
ncbi:hypothetical protein Tdes44962_MAKER08976 [Teratosphaeria destructans]|uniref:Uncharacterized protein n=1 Tax=Teratosphaeria destructans TaxID=418781 RepID=A0A9W7SUP7_9PEZI|nr:hypothetical protein Tdes44962_MAKER08976 [Teratosphaeria destructans]